MGPKQDPGGIQWPLLLTRGMMTQGVVPDAACYNAAMAACARGRESGTAMALLEEMGSDSSERSYGAALSALGKTGQ